MPSNHLKKLDPGHLDALWRVLQNYPELHWSKTSLEETLRSTHFQGWGLFNEAGSLLSFALFSTLLDEAELLLIATNPHYLQQGHAKTLLKSAISALKPCKIFLEVRASNLVARTLYESLGFIEYGRRAQYYKDGEDALLYQHQIME